MQMIELFTAYLKEDNKSDNTIKGYIQSVKGYIAWFEQSKGIEISKLHRENVREYTSYLQTVKNAKPKTINTKLNALVKLNEFFIHQGSQTDMVITKKEYLKVQQQFASLAKVEYKDVEQFRQMILDSGNKRNYAIVTTLGYAGLRISEALNLKLRDVHMDSREIDIVNGKGDKARTVYMSDKVAEAVKDWLHERKSESDYLFASNRNKRMDRTTINKLFNEYSTKIGKEITPHDLRHFFCSNALEKGMSIHEVANQAGHASAQTTMLYTNPTKQAMINKMNQL